MRSWLCEIHTTCKKVNASVPPFDPPCRTIISPIDIPAVTTQDSKPVSREHADLTFELADPAMVCAHFGPCPPNKLFSSPRGHVSLGLKRYPPHTTRGMRRRIPTETWRCIESGQHAYVCGDSSLVLSRFRIIDTRSSRWYTRSARSVVRTRKKRSAKHNTLLVCGPEVTKMIG